MATNQDFLHFFSQKKAKKSESLGCSKLFIDIVRNSLTNARGKGNFCLIPFAFIVKISIDKENCFIWVFGRLK